MKVSDFMFTVPRFPHLRNVEMRVQYQEMNVASAERPRITPPKWKSDPDTDPNQYYIPQPKVYLNGEFIRQEPPLLTRTARNKFPEERVPRREFTQAFPGDPDYEKLCRQQGLEHLLAASSENQRVHQLNGFTPPLSDISKSTTGGSPHPLSATQTNHHSFEENSPTENMPNQVAAATGGS